MSDLTFIEERHEYRFKGQVVPHVTEIIASLLDYSKVDPAVLEWKSELGTAVHLATALDDRGELDEATVDPVVSPYLAAWRKFRAETGFHPMDIEVPRYNKVHGYACTPDRFGSLPGQGVRRMPFFAMVEIKTTAQLHPAVGVQLAAQVDARYASEGSGRDALRYAVQLRADGTYRTEFYGDRGDFSTFLSLLNVFRWRQRNA